MGPKGKGAKGSGSGAAAAAGGKAAAAKAPAKANAAPAAGSKGAVARVKAMGRGGGSGMDGRYTVVGSMAVVGTLGVMAVFAVSYYSDPTKGGAGVRSRGFEGLSSSENFACGTRAREPFPSEVAPLAKAQRYYSHIISQFGEFPWFAHVQLKYECGATIVGDRWLLTTAACCDGAHPVTGDLPLDVQSPQIWVGYHIKGQSNGKYVYADRCFPHNRFDNKTLSNDIALIRLRAEDALSFPPPEGMYYNKICLTSDDVSNRSASFELVGWPRPDNSQLLEKMGKRQTMYKYHVAYYPNTCYQNGVAEDPNSICMWHTNQEAITGLICNGEGGSALMFKSQNDKKVYLLGLVSGHSDPVKRGKPCDGTSNIAMYYTDVPKFHSWILATMNNHNE